jgi:predicted nucleotidyltransferase component of viral defense system
MILQKEISVAAGKYKVRDSQIEKDYILTWFLFGISKNEILASILAFKGGTVLKKNYFEDYRFSEDLDFTLLDESVSNEAIRAELERIIVFIKEEANITLQFGEASGVHKNGSLYYYLNYIGPLNASLLSRDLKIDITRGEILEFEVVKRNTFCTYSDLTDFVLKCYSLEEVLIEKMLAMMGRQEPRDLYDFWYLTEQEGLSPANCKAEFERKAKSKGQNPDEFAEKVTSREANLKKGWISKLENQIHALPKFDDVFREARRNFKF